MIAIKQNGCTAGIVFNIYMLARKQPELAIHVYSIGKHNSIPIIMSMYHYADGRTHFAVGIRKYE